MVRGDEKDKDRRGRLGPRVSGLPEQGRKLGTLSFFFLLSLVPPQRVLSGNSAKSTRGSSPRSENSIFFSRSDRTKERATARRSCIELIEASLPVGTLMNPLGKWLRQSVPLIFFSWKRKEDYESECKNEMFGASDEYSVRNIFNI